MNDIKALDAADESETLELNFHGCLYYKVESTTKVMPHEMYDERIRAHQPQMYVWPLSAVREALKIYKSTQF